MLRLGNAYIADTARVVGDVQLGDQVSIWYGAVIRGDVAPVRIGPGTNVQDNAVIHCDYDQENVIGTDVLIGHSAVVHGRSVGDRTMIGMHATVLGGTRIGCDCLIAAGAVVPPNLQVPDGMLVMGVPGRIVRPVTNAEKAYTRGAVNRYKELAKLHHEKPDDPLVRPWRG